MGTGIVGDGDTRSRLLVHELKILLLCSQDLVGEAKSWQLSESIIVSCVGHL
jgi:hypothetical protein